MKREWLLVPMLTVGMLLSACGGGTSGGYGGSTTTPPPYPVPPPPPPPPPPTADSVTLSWTTPTQNSDGSALANLDGYIINYGTNVNALTQQRVVADRTAMNVTITSLAASTYYFTIKSYTTAPVVESDPSNPVSKTLP